MQTILYRPDYGFHVTNNEHPLMFYASGQEKWKNNLCYYSYKW